MNYFEEPSTPLFLNKSRIKFFSSHDLKELEEQVSVFMLSVKKIYNVKHNITTEDGYTDMHYIMVSYE